MQLHFTGRNVEVTPALKNYASEKFKKLERHHQDINQVNVTFHVENVTHIAEASTHLDKKEFHATAEGADMYAAIDTLIDKLTTQMLKHKEKSNDKRLHD